MWQGINNRISYYLVHFGNLISMQKITKATQRNEELKKEDHLTDDEIMGNLSHDPTAKTHYIFAKQIHSRCSLTDFGQKNRYHHHHRHQQMH